MNVLRIRPRGITAKLVSSCLNIALLVLLFTTQALADSRSVHAKFLNHQFPSQCINRTTQSVTATLIALRHTAPDTFWTKAKELVVIVTTQIQRDSVSNSTLIDLYITNGFQETLGDQQIGSTRWIPVNVNLVRNFALNGIDDKFSAISFSIQLIPISEDSLAKKVAMAIAKASNGLAAAPAAGRALAAFHELSSGLLEEAKKDSEAASWGDMPPQFTLNFAGATCTAGSAWTGVEVLVDRKHKDQQKDGIVDIDALNEYCFFATDETTKEVEFYKKSSNTTECSDNISMSTLLNSHVGIRITVEPIASVAFQRTDAKTFGHVEYLGKKPSGDQLWGFTRVQSKAISNIDSRELQTWSNRSVPQSGYWRTITLKSQLSDTSLGDNIRNPWGPNLVPLVNIYVDNWAFRSQWRGDPQDLQNVKIRTLAFVADPTKLTFYSPPKEWKTGTDVSGNFTVTMSGTESAAYDLARSFVECEHWGVQPEGCVLGK